MSRKKTPVLAELRQIQNRARDALFYGQQLLILDRRCLAEQIRVKAAVKKSHG